MMSRCTLLDAYRNSMPSVESVMTLLSKVAIDMNNNAYQYPVSRFTKSKLFD